MPRRTILVVEDNASIRRGVVDALLFAGYEVVESSDGASASRILKSDALDLVLLDVLLPGKDGFQILEELRMARPRLPVIMLTARGTEEDKVRGLQLGADDYVVKPFSVKELLARVEALLRRAAPDVSGLHKLEIGDRVVDLDRMEVILPDGATRSLSEREAGLLRYLAVHRGRPVERDELLNWVWGYNPRGLETRTVDMHIARLRAKLEVEPSQPQCILTVRSKGYMLTAMESKK